MDYSKDDFEFKPLTDGLGFHKKIIDLKEHPEKFEPLDKPAPGKPVHQSESKAPLWNAALKSKDFIEKKVSKTPKSAPPVKPLTLEPVATSWPAAIFDSTMVLGLLLIFSAVIFAVTGIELNQLIEMLQTEGTAQFGALVLLFSIYEIYTVTCRTFFGKTVGESVFEYRLGSREAQQKVLYPLQVAWRSFAIALTGFVILPLLSSLLKQDLAGILSGVTLYSEKK